MVFRVGKYPQGDWPKERVQKLVDAYDPEKNFGAPVVIGHKWYSQTNEDQYAHGWVESLRMDGAGKVFAVIEDFSADVKKAVAEKKLRYISVEIREYDKNDAEQSPYLKAVALLGRDTPAVQGTKLPLLFSQGVMSVLDEKECISAFTRKVDAEDIKIFASQEGAENQGHEEVKHMDELEKLKADLAAANEELAAFRKENESLRGAEHKAGAETFFSKLRDEGKLPPALFEKVVALDAKLGDGERAELRAVFSAMEITADLSGNHTAPKGKAPKGGEGSSATGVTAKIRAYQKEKGFASFADAAEAFYAANPDAFDDEGGNE
jgi:hypothetical protein